MKLLVIVRNPKNPSFRKRVEPYLDMLKERGVDCHLEILTGKSWSECRALYRSAQNYDGVWLQKKAMNFWDGRLLRKNARRLIFDIDDATMFRPLSIDAKPNRNRNRRVGRAIRMSDLAIVGNEVLAEHAYGYGANRVEIIPTGLATSRYIPKVVEGNPSTIKLVWIGSSSTLKLLRQFESTLRALGEAMPNLVLQIIADADLHIPSLTTESLAWSHDHEAEMLAGADIGIAPMLDTPFTRGKCAFKVLQYMASGLPTVTSPVGANAKYIQPGVTGFHANTAEEWIKAVRTLANDAELRKSMGQAARDLTCTEFDFGVLGPRICDAIIETLQS
ncbi:MAG: glycosyltransferase family 4 protein [Phycisphaerales bacterium]|nr:glycosyltransferase family 4 protein [Phycisphaerales bacterium]MBT7171414.1 glycosyltransferase family 4 protein [Phycisphaerales bacterium]